MGLLSSVVGGITGSTAAGAASSGGRRLSQAALDAGDLRSDALIEGGEIRAQGGRDAFSFLNEQLSPFASSFDAQNIAEINALATDPNAQVDFLSNNPLFEALKNQSREATFRTQSAGGQLGSSGTDEILQNAFLAQGNDLINQQINRQLPLLQGAQNAATNLGTSGANLKSQIAAVLAQGGERSANALANALEGSAQALTTGDIGAANARSQGAQNLIGGIGAISGGGGIGKILGGLF